MPNHKNTAKSLRKDVKRKIRNSTTKSKIRTLVKKVRLTVADKKVDEAIVVLRQAVSELDTAAKNHIIHHRNAARRKSRLMHQVAALEKQQQG